MGMVGTRYRYGGTDPVEGFDCSGLVYYSYGQAGYQRAAHVAELFRAARKISVGEADPGDLMFFQDQTKLSHVGIYLGDGRFVHAPANGQNVAVGSLDSPTIESTSSRSAGCCRTDRFISRPRRAAALRRALARSQAGTLRALAALRRTPRRALVAARRRELVDAGARVEQPLLCAAASSPRSAPGASSANASSSATLFCSRNTRSTYVAKVGGREP